MRNRDHKRNKFELLALVALFGMILSCDKEASKTDLSEKKKPSQTAGNLQDNALPTSSNSESIVNKQGGVPPQDPFLRENIGAELPQIKFHPEVERVRDEISSELTMILHDKAKSSKYVRKKWSELTSALPRTPLASSGDAAISSGSMLPPECAVVLNDSASYIELVLAGKHPAFTKPREIGSAAGIQTLGIGLGDMLPSLLLEYSNDLPPTDLDIAIFTAAITSISDSPQNMTSIEGWGTLAKSKNPIYRLLAIRAAGQGSWGENRNNGILGFSSFYDEEKVPEILSNLAQILATVPSLEARRKLEALSGIAVASDNNFLKEDIDQALRANELILSKTNK